MPELCSLQRSAAALPQRTYHVSIMTSGGRSTRVAVHETIVPNHDRIIVFVHGILSDSRVWRYMRGDLGRDFDLMAIDLPGCGDSDRPTPAELGPRGYSPLALGRAVLNALRQRLAERDALAKAEGRPPARVLLVGHSIGGMIILRALAEPELRAAYADVLNRVDAAALFAPADVTADPNQPTFRRIATVSDVEWALADAAGVLRARVNESILYGVCDPKLAVQEEADRVIEVLRDPPRRHAAAAMLRQALPLRDEAGDRLDWPRPRSSPAGISRSTSPA